LEELVSLSSLRYPGSKWRHLDASERGLLGQYDGCAAWAFVDGVLRFSRLCEIVRGCEYFWWDYAAESVGVLVGGVRNIVVGYWSYKLDDAFAAKTEEADVKTEGSEWGGGS
jgi:hypothetical protein